MSFVISTSLTRATVILTQLSKTQHRLRACTVARLGRTPRPATAQCLALPCQPEEANVLQAQLENAEAAAAARLAAAQRKGALARAVARQAAQQAAADLADVRSQAACSLQAANAMAEVSRQVRHSTLTLQGVLYCLCHAHADETC